VSLIWIVGGAHLGSLVGLPKMKNYIDDVFKLLRFLETNPSLERLQERFPKDWALAEKLLAAAMKDRDKAKLDQLMKPLDSMVKNTKHSSPISKQNARDLQGRLIRQRMTAIAIERYLKGALKDGKRDHFTWLDRFILRRLFFTRQHRRKLVSNSLFRVLWPILRNRDMLMPLAESHGIYCFYSKSFVDGLADLIKSDRCLEIAAGDGALAEFLRKRGVTVLATDDQSWSGKVTYEADVEKLDAKAALEKYSPSVVVCSWPPARNGFEQYVFSTESVQRYIMIGSRHKFAAGNWPVYAALKNFSMRRDDGLSMHLLPADFGGAVYVFDRNNNDRENMQQYTDGTAA
jgi:hypothetical protein